MLQWFAQGLGKGQLCVGSASLTSHHLPTSIISVKEHLGGLGWGGDIEKARLPWSQLIPLRCWGCRSGYESWRGFYSARLISEPGGGPFQVERLGVCSVVKSPETCRVKARWTRMWACVCACVCVCVCVKKWVGGKLSGSQSSGVLNALILQNVFYNRGTTSAARESDSQTRASAHTHTLIRSSLTPLTMCSSRL